MDGCLVRQGCATSASNSAGALPAGQSRCEVDSGEVWLAGGEQSERRSPPAGGSQVLQDQSPDGAGLKRAAAVSLGRGVAEVVMPPWEGSVRSVSRIHKRSR